jgi:RNA polymerase sigma factor (sigma-70 family)
MPRALKAPIDTIRRIAARADDRLDEVLLRRFVEDREEESFRAIVRRHGGMVLDVCQSVLRNHADAEDAFQAVFLALSANARSVRTPAALAGWLHAAACRVARKARLSRQRRQHREARTPSPRNLAPPDPSWAEVREAIHEEVNRLPERYRAAVVLFYLTGLKQDEVGAALGLSKDGAKKRLERGRSLLRAALDRRGFAPVAVLAAATVAPKPAPAALASTTATLAAQHTAGTGLVADAILQLATTGVKPMFTKLTVAATSSLLVAAIAFGVHGSGAGGSSDAVSPGPTATARQNAVASEKDPAIPAELGKPIGYYERAFRAQSEFGSRLAQPKPVEPDAKKLAPPKPIGPGPKKPALPQPAENEVILAALCWAVKERMRDRELQPWIPGEKPIQVDWPLDDRFVRFAALDLCGVLPSGVTDEHLNGVWLDLYGLPLTKDEKEKAALAWRKLRGS